MLYTLWLPKIILILVAKILYFEVEVSSKNACNNKFHKRVWASDNTE
jgi:hypothetical protein